MKTLYVIGGTMGVGKTTVCRRLKQILEHSVFLDGDWCWDANPFVVTEETREMVTDNICHLLNNFLKCSAYQNVIFCWVLHEQQIIDSILSRLCTDGCEVRLVSLTCDEKTLRERLQRDVDAGIRKPDIIARSVARIPLYELLNTARIDTSHMSPEETAEKIAKGEIFA